MSIESVFVVFELVESQMGLLFFKRSGKFLAVRFLTFKIIFILSFHVVYMHHGAYVGAMWRSEVKLEALVLFAYYVGPGDGAAVVRLAASALTYESISLFYSLIFLPSFLSCFSHCLHGVHAWASSL